MSAPTYDDGNVFAKILRGELPAERLYEDDHTLAIMDIMPRGDGHCLVIPKTPARNVLDADTDSLAAVAATTQLMARTVMKAFGADGVTIQQFNESAGGQVVFHLHVHVIPRFDGIAMKPHTGTMEDADVLKANAEKIRAALA
ncbi:Diadenosine tetraphosphate (Ap4A) hydrolase and other HIT family hydrolase [Hoeflea phototrophica DFL-43]|jgi:histidine triad (HIT) family protein|uniref:Diadenosine tetraphosphate (Ap4A) hydrolase and other HIT family hydrolase n=1 Tax=Hoeflea phototrophica (strain DSM 17068 / NCIMB 14078 / DFL-43) TaxID=411684 RepID=A9DCU9_HOEPD|nr:HIT family protein [Hoeflea phototrophica]EDQ32211.1 Diadenosine tetraphosphate (Ap4A) hydrolase and other HIT family hydrolase [Hoeflea phototrophica DFL-43]